MKNIEIAKIFYDIADIFEIQNVQWKPQAYRRAARSIESLSEDIEVVYKRSGLKALMEIPGVGEGIAKRIEEFLKTGKIEELEKLRKGIPTGVTEMMSIPGMGPKKSWRLYKELKIESMEKLQQAIKEGKLRKLKGFGEKSEQDILAGIEIVKKGQERMLLGKALPLARIIVEKLKSLKEVEKIDIAGSLRRRKETIGDIDILVISKNPKVVMDFFVKLDDVASIVAKGETKSAVILKEGINCDLRVLEERSYGAGLMYFTGSKDHNIALRELAIKKGHKLSEYGLFQAKTERFVCGRTEEEVYEKLGMQYIGPEIRENLGEVELALKEKLPKLIPYNSIKGDLQVHSRWSDGNNSVEEMLQQAIKMGYEYLGITDHSKSERVAGGMDEKTFLKYIESLDKLKKRYENKIEVLIGSEVDILPNGSLDYTNKLLKKLDVVVASVHSRFKMTKEEMTKRVLKALENPYVTILAHPTGRLIGERNPFDIDIDKIIETAKENNIILEINAHPNRLDLKDSHIKLAVESGAKLIIDTDSHSTEHMRYMEFGVSQARRGWATENDVVNTLPWKKFQKVLDI